MFFQQDDSLHPPLWSQLLGTICQRLLLPVGLTGNFYLGCYGSWLIPGYHSFPRLSLVRHVQDAAESSFEPEAHPDSREARKEVSCIT